MSTSTIEFTFEGLCPFFTSELTEEKSLMVGLIGVFEPNKVTHAPTLRIFENPLPEPITYRGTTSRRLLTGDAYLHIISNNGIAAKDITSDTSVKFLDIEELYPTETLEIDPQGCQARLHFNNGVLSQIRPNRVIVKALGSEDEEEEEEGEGEHGEHGEHGEQVPKQDFSYSVKLVITIPEDSYAVLHFQGDTDDYVFKAGKNYRVEVRSLPLPGNHDHQVNHFQYFYRLVNNPPNPILVPIDVYKSDSGDPTCMLAAFAKTRI
jgi:hypothetical protein